MVFGRVTDRIEAIIIYDLEFVQGFFERVFGVGIIQLSATDHSVARNDARRRRRRLQPHRPRPACAQRVRSARTTSNCQRTRPRSGDYTAPGGLISTLSTWTLEPKGS